MLNRNKEWSTFSTHPLCWRTAHLQSNGSILYLLKMQSFLNVQYVYAINTIFQAFRIEDNPLHINCEKRYLRLTV